MDLSHGLPYTASMDIYAGDYKDVADCGLIIIIGGSESETGRDASGPDREECRYIKIDRSADHGDGVRRNFNDSCQSSGCADLCGTADIRLSGGESLWLRYGFGYGETQISGWRHLDVDSRSVHAVIIGEHGDSRLPVWTGRMCPESI